MSCEYENKKTVLVQNIVYLFQNIILGSPFIHISMLYYQDKKYNLKKIKVSLFIQPFVTKKS